jgi:nitroimidazol reductase NimA-like FMN-containing flavoprotein (pyridoxamine 5'-phosphate oxidase superfamily)
VKKKTQTSSYWKNNPFPGWNSGQKENESMNDAAFKEMKEMLLSADLLVLATTSPRGPHCSLMACAAEENGLSVLLVTPRDTAKYENMQSNPSVCLLVDDRQQNPEKRSALRALTVNGSCEFLSGEEEEAAKTAVVERNPHLADFATRPDVAALRIRPKSLQLLKGPSDSYYVTLK